MNAFLITRVTDQHCAEYQKDTNGSSCLQGAYDYMSGRVRKKLNSDRTNVSKHRSAIDGVVSVPRRNWES